jgi:Ger(x)C family germination protein
MGLRKAGVFLITVVMLFATGCWDKVEIEQRGFIALMTVDMNEKQEEKKQEDSSKGFLESGQEKFKFVFGIVIPSKIQEGGETAALPKEVTAVNFPDAIEKLSAQVSRLPFFGHARTLTFGEGLLKDDKAFREILDYLDRSAIINQQMNIVATKGNTDQLLKVEPKLENLVAAVINGIMQNSRYITEVPTMDLTGLLIALRNNEGSAAIPVLEVEEEEIVINKLVLIKDYKLLNYLDTRYVGPFKIITDDLKSGRKLVDYKGSVIPYYIHAINKRTWMEEVGDKLKYTVKIEIEADVRSYEFGKDLFDVGKIKELEAIANNSLEGELEETTNYFQDVIGHDYLEFGDYTHKNHNNVYQKYEKNWDEQFKKADINYDVDVKIRRVGTVR